MESGPEEVLESPSATVLQGLASRQSYTEISRDIDQKIERLTLEGDSRGRLQGSQHVCRDSEGSVVCLRTFAVFIL